MKYCLLFILLLMSSANADNGPSFDCSKARTKTEHTICNSAELANIDLNHSTIYKKVSQTLSDKDADKLQKEQRVFLKSRSKCSDDVLCLVDLYKNRTLQIQTDYSRSTNVDKEIIFSKDLHYHDFHDPGRLITKEGFTIGFHYVGITYENISTWGKGRVLQLRYSRSDGASLYDAKSGYSAFILNYDEKAEHPIDLLESTCDGGSTMDIVTCFDRSFDLWSVDIERSIEKAEKYMSKETYKDLLNMQKHWNNYRETKFAVNRQIHQNDGGTISIIESASRANSAVKEHALYLNSVLNHVMLKASYND